MKRVTTFAIALALIATGCISDSANERTILVDYSSDEFSSFMLDNFPGKVIVGAGTTLVFKQTWTGEPHTVTGGTLVDDMMKKSKPFMDLFMGFEALVASGVDLPEEGEEPDMPAAEFFRRVDEAEDANAKRQLYSGYDALREQGLKLPDRKDPGDATNGDIDEVLGPAGEEFFDNIRTPWAIDENETGAFFITQNGGQPCYLTTGGPPKKTEQACRQEQQRQPAFEGTATYYNSGIIPYEGPRGNTFRVELTPDIDPGNYFFYCSVHGPGQSTEVEVTNDSGRVQSQEEINRQARKEIEEYVRPMQKLYRDAARDAKAEMVGEKLEGPFAGLYPRVHAAINEMVPKTIRTNVGDEVTWKILGADHSISFDVPKYFPIMTFANDGTIELNPRLQEPAGGSPKIREQEGEGIFRVDGGTYDGDGFFSSGLFGAEPYAEYTLRFSQSGTYKYACLLHPPMVGTVVVS